MALTGRALAVTRTNMKDQVHLTAGVESVVRVVGLVWYGHGLAEKRSSWSCGGRDHHCTLRAPAAEATVAGDLGDKQQPALRRCVEHRRATTPGRDGGHRAIGVAVGKAPVAHQRQLLAERALPLWIADTFAVGADTSKLTVRGVFARPTTFGEWTGWWRRGWARADAAGDGVIRRAGTPATGGGLGEALLDIHKEREELAAGSRQADRAARAGVRSGPPLDGLHVCTVEIDADEWRRTRG